jgi:tRNA dimethylallyltransferase
MTSLIAIVGPTAVGKSNLAIKLAHKFRGEIINADSRQIYKQMDIGTAKPTPSELSAIRHHLIDLINPDDQFSLSIYQKLVSQTIMDVKSRHKTPFLVGGTGQYVWAVIEGWQIPGILPDLEFRRSMETRAEQEGPMPLYEELKLQDGDAAKRITPANVRRVIRALEIAKSREKTSSTILNKKNPQFNVLTIGLNLDRQALYKKIDNRVDEMIKKGLIDEVKALLNKGYGLDLPSMSGIGYKQIGLYLTNQISLEDAVQKIKYATHSFARRQYNWFRLTDKRIKWFDVASEIEDNISELVSDFLQKSTQKD